MNLKDEFQDLAIEMIDTTDGFLDVAQPVTVVRPVRETYIVETGAVYETTMNVTVNGIVSPWEEDNSAARNSDQIQTEDLKLLVAYKDLQNYDSTVEDEEDKILPLRVNYDRVIVENIEYDIIQLKLTAAKALYVLRLAKVIDPAEE